MSRINAGNLVPTKLLTRPVALFFLGFVLLFAQAGQADDGPLKFYKNYFVTGDYVVGGTSLFRKGVNGLASQDINITGVPADAEILAAFLYVQTTSRESLGPDAGIANATFRGNPLNTPFGPIAKALNWDAGTQACWSYGWNPRRRLITYRADVLRFLPIDPATGKHKVNGPHRVQVADAGRGSFFNDDEDDGPTMTGPRAVGASLVIVYRSADPAYPLKSVVIYDGGVTKRSLETLNQSVRGFYDASAGSARMTHIVGDGQLFFSEKVQIDAQTATNPFIGASGLRWDNKTFNLTLPVHAASTAVTVKPNGLLSDCLSYSAIVFSTKVEDTDGDGLLDVWESSAGSLVDPNNQPLPNLHAMSADPNVKDLFVEIGYMGTNTELTYGGVPKPAHSHLPTNEALKLVGDAFLARGIKVHFDVGPGYPVADPPNPYIVPPAFARGGEAINELATVCAPSQSDPTRCQFSAYPGTVGWKTGFRFFRDELLDPAANETACDQPGANCERRFDRNRKDMFRYVLFAHALGLPKEPCLDANGAPILSCQQQNADFHVPKTNSGVGDWAGGDLLVTLGAFVDGDKPVGTTFMQASTLMHEWGHNFGRRHGGDLGEPNCKPNYLSVMNYLFQLRGLIDDAGAAHLDYSGNVIEALQEGFLSDSSLGALPYRTGWYAPQAGSYLENLASAATKHCDGTALLPSDPAMVRVDGVSRTGPIDWNANGDLDTSTPAQDINFDGEKTPLNPGSNDWAKLRLNQLGSRRTVGGLYVRNNVTTVGSLSLDTGRGDLGRGDLGRGDLGRGDLGRGDLGRGDLGRGDLGRGDLGGLVGRGDLGRGDLGGGDLDVGAPGEPVGELDLETFTAAVGDTPTPPTALAACLTAGGQCVVSGGDRPVRLTWQAPHVGTPVRYFIYRFEVDPDAVFPPAQLPAEPIDVVESSAGAPPTFFVDNSAWGDGHFAYFVSAQFDDQSQSGISNFATISTPSATLPPGAVLPICGDQDTPQTLVFNCEAYHPVPNLQVYRVPDAATQLTFDFVYRSAGFNNELAAFKVDDAIGGIGSLHPGDPGYLAAALARAQVIFASGSDAFTADVSLSTLPVTGALHGGDRITFMIIQDNTLANLRTGNPGNALSGSPIAFFSLNGLNPDSYDHVFAFENNDGIFTEFGFEDLVSGGDNDFDDLVFTVRGLNPTIF
jgi:hypothetical protein